MVYDAGTSKTIKRFLNLEEHQGRGNFKKMNEQNLRTLRKLVTPYEKSDLQKVFVKSLTHWFHLSFYGIWHIRVCRFLISLH